MPPLDVPEKIREKLEKAGVSLKRKVVVPNLVDAHVHFRCPGGEAKEDWKTGSRAAIAGGITCVLEMPNTDPPTTDQKAIDAKSALAKRDSLCNYGFFVGATPDNAAEIAKIKGAVGVKAYVGSSTGNLLVHRPDALEKIFRAAKQNNLVVCVHAEDEAVVQANLEKAREKKWDHVRYHARIRSDEAEAKAIAECLRIQGRVGNRLHVCHLSSQMGLEQIRQAKAERPDLALSTEVTPNHLFLSEDDVPRLGNFGKVNPAIKSRADQQALWKGLRTGVIDCVATDHAPHTVEEKQKPYAQAPSGMTGVETMVPLLAHVASSEKIGWSDVEAWCAKNPARIFGLSLSSNYTVIDPSDEWKIQNDRLFTKCKWSPFDGWTGKGRVVATIVSDQLVFQDGVVKKNRGSVAKHVA